MFDALCQLVPRDRDLPARAWRLECLRRVREGTVYDGLLYEFHQERQSAGAGEYITIAQRRPSVRAGLCRLVVDESATFLFGEGRFPAIECIDEAVRDGVARLIRDTRLPAVMQAAALMGSIGSVCVLMRVLGRRLFWKALDTVYLTPTWRPDAPDTLQSVTERYKVVGQTLRDLGYDIATPDLQVWFWFERQWDAQAETWFVPRKVGAADQTRQIDTARTVRHGLGFVPMVWIRNLPGGDEMDGACTFKAGIETAIEVDYQLSQAGRGLKYSSDPLLMIREPAAEQGQFVRSASNALIVASGSQGMEGGDAKLLEISGSAAGAVGEHVRVLTDAALRAMHGYRGTPEKMTTALSGRALELLYQPTVAQADRLRSSYGEDGLLPLLDMVRRVRRMQPLVFRDGTEIPELPDNEPITLRWPGWFPPAAEDLQSQALTLTTLVGGGLMAQATAVKSLAATYDIEDTEAELALIAADQATADARAAEQAKSLAAVTPKPI